MSINETCLECRINTFEENSKISWLFVIIRIDSTLHYLICTFMSLRLSFGQQMESLTQMAMKIKGSSPPSHISHQNYNQVLDKSYAHKIIGEWSLMVNIKFIHLAHSLQDSRTVYAYSYLKFLIRLLVL